MAAFVGVAGLAAAGDDGVGGMGAGAGEGHIDFGLEGFAGEDASAPPQGVVTGGFCGAKDVAGAGHAGFGGALGLEEELDFAGGLEGAARDEGSAAGGGADAEAGEVGGEAVGEVAGDFDGADAVLLEDGGDDFGEFAVFGAGGVAFFEGGKREAFVGAGGSFGAVDFEVGEEEDGAAADLEPGEGVWGGELGEVEEIGVGFGGGTGEASIHGFVVEWLGIGAASAQAWRVSIATKTGDDGTTGLMFNRRVAKADPRVGAYGAVDELNAAIGLARAFREDAEVCGVLLGIQKELVGLMGELATAREDRARYYEAGFQRLTAEMVDRLEAKVHEIEKRSLGFDGWDTPGATPMAGALHVARTVCRRAEREILLLGEEERRLNPEIVRYLNRLSDLLWLFARVVEAGAPEAGGD